MKTLLMSTAAAALLFAGTAQSEDVSIFVDTDNDGRISMAEYEAALAEPNDAYWFDLWDTDRDAVLTREEVNRGWFAQYDMDQDELLTQEEVRAWNEDNSRLNAMRSGREVSAPDSGAAGAATQ